MVLGTIQGAFSGASGVLGVSAPLSVSLHSLFIVVSFLLNGVPRVGICPISPPLQLLGVVVKAKKYGYVRHKALNEIMELFPLTFPFSLLSFFALVLFLFRGMIWSVITSGRLPPLSSATSMQRRVLPMADEGFFLGLGPWPNVDIDMDLLVF